MALWRKEDSLAGVPTWTDSDTAFFVDEAEAALASNRAKGLKTPGWWKYELQNGRHRAECLVAMTDTTGAGDAGVTGNTAVEDTTVADS